MSVRDIYATDTGDTIYAADADDAPLMASTSDFGALRRGGGAGGAMGAMGAMGAGAAGAGGGALDEAVAAAAAQHQHAHVAAYQQRQLERTAVEMRDALVKELSQLVGATVKTEVGVAMQTREGVSAAAAAARVEEMTAAAAREVLTVRGITGGGVKEQHQVMNEDGVHGGGYTVREQSEEGAAEDATEMTEDQHGDGTSMRTDNDGPVPSPSPVKKARPPILILTPRLKRP